MNTFEIPTKPILMYLLQHFDCVSFEMLVKFKTKLYIELKDYCCYWPLDKYSINYITEYNPNLFICSINDIISKNNKSIKKFEDFDIRTECMPNEYINAILSINLEDLK